MNKYLFYVTGIMLLFLLAMTMFVDKQLEGVAEKIEKTEGMDKKWLISDREISGCRVALGDYLVSEFRHINTSDATSKRMIEEEMTSIRRRLRKSLDHCEKLVVTGKELHLVKSIKKVRQNYFSEFYSPLIDLSRQGRTKEATKRVLSGSNARVMKKLKDMFDELVTENKKESTKTMLESDLRFSNIRGNIWVAFIIVAVVATAIVLLVALNAEKRIRKETYGKGDSW